jgi:putative tributyrin esterase
MAIIQMNFNSRSLEMNTMLTILMPDQRQQNEQFKILYLLHGYMGDHTDWTRYTSLERYLFGERLMVVMPAVHNSYYANMVYGMKFFDYIAKELPEMIESIYPVSKDREDHYIAGLSMGGYGAFKVALTYPNYFSKAASLSGALDIDAIEKLVKDTPRESIFKASFGQQHMLLENDLFHLVSENIKHHVQMPKLYMACGTEDFLYQDNLKFKSYLEQNQIPFTYSESPGVHDWNFWDTFIQKVLKWIKK